MVKYGDCFETAAALVFSDPSLMLVHGRPVAQRGGSATPGERFWHAWAEETQEFAELLSDADDVYEVEYVIDKSNGRDISMPRESYYAIGKMSDEHVRRYTRDEARELMLEFKHYGPWDEEHPPGGWADE